jgi:serine/threonine protein kinase
MNLDTRYEVLTKLKEGGMGAIYKVRHRNLDVVRVVKLLKPQHQDDVHFKIRFVNEARAAAGLDHPNLVRINDFKVDDFGQGSIEMEYVDGFDLTELLARSELPSIPLTLEIARQGLRVLGFLHGHGFVHRDVSPDNFMLTEDVDGEVLVKLIDLGIAKRPGGRETEGFLGKLLYASPEHFGPSDRIDGRSDLYSFGIVLYELLTGRSPIGCETATMSELMRSHLQDPPLTFDATDPQGRVPKELREIVLKALAKSPVDRFASAAEFSAEIERLQSRYPLTEAVVSSWSSNMQAPDESRPSVSDLIAKYRNTLRRYLAKQRQKAAARHIQQDLGRLIQERYSS